MSLSGLSGVYSNLAALAGTSTTVSQTVSKSSASYAELSGLVAEAVSLSSESSILNAGTDTGTHTAVSLLNDLIAAQSQSGSTATDTSASSSSSGSTSSSTSSATPDYSSYLQSYNAVSAMTDSGLISALSSWA